MTTSEYELAERIDGLDKRLNRTMKKITLTLLALLALTLTGCGYNDDALMKAEYEGHSYIIYKGSQKGGIIHDPDCTCREKGGVE